MAKTDPTANWSKYLWCILIKQENLSEWYCVAHHFWHHEIPPISSISSSPVCLVSLCVLLHRPFDPWEIQWFRWISVDSVDCPWALHVHIPQQLLDEFVVSRCWYSATSVGSCVSLSSSKRTCWQRCGFVGGWTRTKAGGSQIGFFGGGIWNGFFSLHFQMEGGFSAEARISRYVECDYLNQIVLKQWKGWMSDDI